MTQILENTLSQLDQEKKSWRIRYALAELLPVMAEHLDKTQVKGQLIRLATQLLQDNEQEVKSIMLLKMPELVNKAGRQVLREQLMPLLSGVTTDTSQYVRISLANVLVKLGNHFEDKDFQEHIIPLMQKMFKDESLEVKSALITSFREVNTDSAVIQEKILSLIGEITEEKNWRVRLAMATYLPELSKSTSLSLYRQKIAPLQHAFLMDHYFTIRQVVYANYARIADIYGQSLIATEVLTQIEMQSSSSNYIFRIQALKGLVAVKDLMTREQLSDCMGKLWRELKEDKIANVRFNLIKAFGSLKGVLSPETEREVSQWVKSVVQSDPDPDVKAFGQLAIN